MRRPRWHFVPHLMPKKMALVYFYGYLQDGAIALVWRKHSLCSMNLKFIQFYINIISNMKVITMLVYFFKWEILKIIHQISEWNLNFLYLRLSNTVNDSFLMIKEIHRPNKNLLNIEKCFTTIKGIMRIKAPWRGKIDIATRLASSSRQSDAAWNPEPTAQN